MKKKLFTLLLMTMATSSIFAIPAKRGIWKTLTLQDGTTVKVELRGDEFLKFWQDESGKRYTLNAEGHLELADMPKLQQVSKLLREQASPILQTDGSTSKMRRSVKRSVSFQGNKRCLIILVQFSDMAFSMDAPQAHYTKVANEPGFSEGKFKGSVADYFRDQSNGQFNLSFDVVGPYTLGSYKTYGANDDNGSDKNAQAMIAAACSNAAHDGVDFTPYDWNGDGIVEMVYVIYAGRGEANGGSADTVWPHKSAFTSPMKYGNKSVQVYACSNEMKTDKDVEGIGTICHEFSHCLGYPDAYDTAYGGWFGMGDWDLMCSGSYNGDGFVPAGYTAYEKWTAGWIEPIELKKATEVSGMESVANGGNAYKFTNPNFDDEYYIIENRRREGWDAALPASGVIINHIDYNKKIWDWNIPNTKSAGTSYAPKNDHERLTIIPADNVKTSASEAGDPWPNGNRNRLANSTSPAAKCYNANTDGTNMMNIAISNIAIADDGTASFSFTNYNDASSQEGYILRETFNKCQGTGGNDEKGFYPKGISMGFAAGTFTPDVTGWEGDYMKGANQCARFGMSSDNLVEITSPEFEINGEATLTFKAAPYGKEDANMSLTVEGAELSESNFTLTFNQWNEEKVTIKGNGKVRIKFTCDHAFFLDDVLVPKVATGISSIILDETAAKQKGIYSLDGKYVGNKLSKLQKGIYVVNGKKVIK